MGGFFTAILGKIVSLAGWIGTLAVACFAAFWLLGTDLGAWLFDQVLGIVISVLNSFEYSMELFDPSPYLSGLPPDLLNMMGLLHFGEALAIIGSACILRILMQLVPFTRLGS